MPPESSSDTSHDSGVFRVAGSSATPDQVRLPAPAKPLEAPAPLKQSMTHNTAAAATDDDETLRIAARAERDVRIPAFAPPIPPTPSGAGAPTPISVRRSLEKEHRVPLQKVGGSSSAGSALQSGIARDMGSLGTPPGGFALPVMGVRPVRTWRRNIRVSARKLEFPRVCACCGELPDAVYEARHTRTRAGKSDTAAWSFPYCQSCLAHVRRVRLGQTLNRAAMMVAGALGLFLGWRVGEWLGALLLGGGFLTAVWVIGRQLILRSAESLAHAGCACLAPAVAYRGFHGTVHDFAFASESYAARFADANRSKLVDEK